MHEPDRRLEARVGRWIGAEGLFPDWTADEVEEVARAVAGRVTEPGSAEDLDAMARRLFREWRRPLPRTDLQNLSFYNVFLPSARRIVEAQMERMGFHSRSLAVDSLRVSVDEAYSPADLGPELEPHPGPLVDPEILAQEVLERVLRELRRTHLDGYTRAFLTRRIKWRTRDRLREIRPCDLDDIMENLEVRVSSLDPEDRERLSRLKRDLSGVPSSGVRAAAWRVLEHAPADSPLHRVVDDLQRSRLRRENEARCEVRARALEAVEEQIQLATDDVYRHLSAEQRSYLPSWLRRYLEVEDREFDYGRLTDRERREVNRVIVEKFGIKLTTKRGRSILQWIEELYAPRVAEFVAQFRRIVLSGGACSPGA